MIGSSPCAITFQASDAHHCCIPSARFGRSSSYPSKPPRRNGRSEDARQLKGKNSCAGRVKVHSKRLSANRSPRLSQRSKQRTPVIHYDCYHRPSRAIQSEEHGRPLQISGERPLRTPFEERQIHLAGRQKQSKDDHHLPLLETSNLPLFSHHG